MTPRPWLIVGVGILALIPAFFLGLLVGRGSQTVATRDVVVTSDTERTIAWAGTTVHLAAEVRTEQVKAWKWRTVYRPDGTITQTATAREERREEKRESKTSTAETRTEKEAIKTRTEEHTRTEGKQDRFSVSLMLGVGKEGRGNGVLSRHYGVSAGVRIVGPLYIGGWILDPHEARRIGGGILSVTW